MAYFCKDSFILKINFDLIWRVHAGEEKNGEEEGNDFFSH